MAEVSITPSLVLPDADADYYRGIAGATIVAGSPVYLDNTTNRLMGADANGSVETAEARGIALHAASAEQPLKIQTGGTLTIGGTVVLATIYILGAAGGIAPSSDAVSGWYTTVLAVAISATKLRLGIFASRALKA